MALETRDSGTGRDLPATPDRPVRAKRRTLWDGSRMTDAIGRALEDEGFYPFGIGVPSTAERAARKWLAGRSGQARELREELAHTAPVKAQSPTPSGHGTLGTVSQPNTGNPESVDRGPKKLRHVRVSDEVWVAASIKANAEGLLISDVVRRLLAEYVAQGGLEALN